MVLSIEGMTVTSEVVTFYVMGAYFGLFFNLHCMHYTLFMTLVCKAESSFVQLCVCTNTHTHAHSCVLMYISVWELV